LWFAQAVSDACSTQAFPLIQKEELLAIALETFRSFSDLVNDDVLSADSFWASVSSKHARFPGSLTTARMCIGGKEPRWYLSFATESWKDIGLPPKAEIIKLFPDILFSHKVKLAKKTTAYQHLLERAVVPADLWDAITKAGIAAEALAKEKEPNHPILISSDEDEGGLHLTKARFDRLLKERDELKAELEEAA